MYFWMWLLFCLGGFTVCFVPLMFPLRFLSLLTPISACWEACMGIYDFWNLQARLWKSGFSYYLFAMSNIPLDSSTWHLQSITWSALKHGCLLWGPNRQTESAVIQPTNHHVFFSFPCYVCLLVQTGLCLFNAGNLASKTGWPAWYF